jgi:phenylacetate-CoA ligase
MHVSPYQIELEQIPLSGLQDIQHKRLTEVLTRASNSGLYRRHWRLLRFKPIGIRSINDLMKVPFTTEHDLMQACQGKRIASLACSEVKAWFRMKGKEDNTYWIPYGKKDFALAWELSVRMSRTAGIRDDDIVLVLSQPAPWFSNALPYTLAYGQKLKGESKVQIIPMSFALLETRRKWLAFLAQIRPTVLIASPSEALRLCEIIRDTGVKSSGDEESSSSARIKKANAEDEISSHKLQHALKSVRMIILYDKELDSHHKRLRDEYSAEIFEAYGLTNLGQYSIECKAHQGIHIWLDVCIPEMIPLAELEMEAANPSHDAQTVLLSEAEAGSVGELVVTTFGEALPLIRYRTRDRVRLMNSEKCQCGITHPIIRLYD